MLELYGIGGSQRDALLAMAKEARKRGWWHPYSAAVPRWFETYVSLEEEAVRIRAYESELIPGLMQTEEYSRATILAEPLVPESDEIDRRVAVRLERRKRLTGDAAPTIWVVVNEATIRRVVGGAPTMRAQLRHLLSTTKLNNIILQVLPFEAGAHPGMDGAFTILQFPESIDPDLVYVEYRAGSLYLEDPSEVDTYNVIFDHLRARALGPDESRALIAKAADDLS